MPDGFHAIFSQKYWNMVGAEVSNICLQVLKGETSITNFSNTNVILILKIQSPLSLKDFRHISLCSVIYKTVTKALANRLKNCLPAIISPSQSASVPGRQIFNNVVASFEILHSIARKKSRKKGLMALKLDMSKVYDRVEWSFLKDVMERMQFPVIWIKLIMECISTFKRSFLFIGSLIYSVVPSRGLRQGCPLSPYLFLLCAEAISCLIANSENNGQALGIKCCRNSPIISHSFFADDNILFCKASVDSSIHIRNLLGIYERGSGQQVNL
ncbi:hypothetical protein Ddye_008376 [Dipteronia dyeriana]|uniref:Reverse transcriptase domain-containing protein n=1 Tax=Dipteronia dyeriana TaxID=168575 RepID=A0AAD9X9F6_9ROSI|nr:hypothetical protein Ddye_008376 [Dipteronia dyeriana]